MTAVPGSWNIHNAISQRWTDAGLDASFRAEWTDPTDTAHQPLNDMEARPNTPPPYCVFEVELPVTIGHSTAAANSGRECKYVRIGVTFTIYAKRQTDGESGKSVANRLLQLVCSKFDPGAGVWPIPTDARDYIQQIRRAAEWLVRHDENTWEGTVRYEVFVQEFFDRRP